MNEIIQLVPLTKRHWAAFKLQGSARRFKRIEMWALVRTEAGTEVRGWVINGDDYESRGWIVDHGDPDFDGYWTREEIKDYRSDMAEPPVRTPVYRPVPPVPPSPPPDYGESGYPPPKPRALEQGN